MHSSIEINGFREIISVVGEFECLKTSLYLGGNLYHAYVEEIDPIARGIFTDAEVPNEVFARICKVECRIPRIHLAYLDVVIHDDVRTRIVNWCELRNFNILWFEEIGSRLDLKILKNLQYKVADACIIHLFQINQSIPFCPFMLASVERFEERGVRCGFNKTNFHLFIFVSVVQLILAYLTELIVLGERLSKDASRLIVSPGR